MTEKTFAQALIEDRRRAILSVLAQTQDSVNEYMLRRLLDKTGTATAMLHADLRWLAGEGLIELTDIENMLLARLTALGCDVERGRTTIKGVASRVWQ